MTAERIALELLLAAGLSAAAVGCGPAPGGTPSAAYDRYVITAQEIATVEVRTTALQMIERMRPNWLQSRGPSGVRGEAAVVIYVNNQRVSESPLSRFTAGELTELRFLNAVEATQKYGTGHGSGAILLTTR